MTLPEGFTINPDAADGQTMLHGRPGRTSARRAPPTVPTTPRSAPSRSAPEPWTGARRRDLHRRTEARRPVPALPDRSTVRHPREVRRLGQTGPVDRPGHGLLRRPAAGPVRRLPASPLRLRPRPDGDADRCTIYTTDAVFFPWNDSPAGPGIEPDLRSRLRPQREPLPGSGPAVQPAARRRNLQPRRGQLQLLHAEARPRRRRPVPRQAQLHDAAGLDRRPARHHLLPGGCDRRRGPASPGAPSRRARAARRLTRSAPPTSPPARAPTRSTRWARCTSPARSRARRCRLVAITPALAGPYDYGTVVVRVAICMSTRSTPT